MLDMKYIRENLAEVKKALGKKHTEFDIGGLLKLDDARKEILSKVEDLRAKRNELAQKKELEGGKKIKAELEELTPQYAKAELAFNDAMAKMHNMPDKTVPSYQDGSKIERTWGEKPKFDGNAKNHLEIGEALDIIDVERAAKVSGSRMGYLKNEGALLEFGLINYLLDKLGKQGFMPMIVPVLVKERAMFGTGFFPTEKKEYYKTAEDDLYLAGTAEVPLCSYHADEILEGEKLPLKYVGFSTCFRREAGTYGKDTQGILRVHQFDKLEMFVFADPQNSWEEFEKLQKIVEEIFQDLALPYQVVNMSGGDIGAPNAKKYDTEVWLPGQNQYRELTSCSHDTDFQARRLNIKCKTKNGKTDLVHTMNSTATAFGRTIIAILENYQQKDGSVTMPKTLIPYLGFEKIPKK